MRVLVFGDSITQGYWDTDGGWVDRLRNHFDSRQVQDLQRDEPSIFNLGISADNSGNVLARIAAETKARTRHNKLPIVIVQIGINDSSTGSPQGVGVPIEQYAENLRGIIDTAKPLSSKIILVGLSACDESRTTPVSWGDFYYTNAAIKRYEDTMKAVAAEHDIPSIPVFDAFLKATAQGKDILPDGLHPNNDGHKVLYDIVSAGLIPLL